MPSVALGASIPAGPRRAPAIEASLPRAVLEQEALDSKRGLSWGAFPIITYNSDIGLGLGLGLAIFDYGEGRRPYRHALLLSGFISTELAQKHTIDWSAPNIGGSGLSLRVKTQFDRQIDAMYFRLGNLAPYDPRYTNPRNAAFVSKKYYLFRHSTPSLNTQLRIPLSGPFELWAGYSFRYHLVEPYQDSLLSIERPLGVDGGVTSMLHFGLILDTRDRPTATSAGHWIELSLRASPKLLGSSTNFGGLTLADHHFFNPVGGLVLANRVLLDMQIGSVPFSELNQFGDTAMTDGLGGAWSMRGFSANRFIGKIKLLINPEIRYRFLTWRWWRQRFDLSVVGFLDAGRVWRDYAADGPLGKIHVSGGGGLRLVWDQNFLARFEVGGSREGPRFFVEIAAPY